MKAPIDYHQIHYGNLSGVHTAGVRSLCRQTPSMVIPSQNLELKDADATHSPCQQLIKGLNISERYAEGIQGFGICRELVQNWIDQCENLCRKEFRDGVVPQTWYGAASPTCRERLVTLTFESSQRQHCFGFLLEFQGDDGYRYIQLTNFATVLPEDSLMLGHTAGKGTKSAGGFGEGMKVEINRLTASGIEVKYFHGRSVWEFVHDKSMPMNQAVELLLRRTTLDQYHGHLTVILHIPPTHQIGSMQKFLELENYLKLTLSYVKPMAGAVLTCENSEIELLLEDKFHGKVFVNGIFVCDKLSCSKQSSNYKSTSRDVDACLEGVGINFVGRKETYDGDDGIDFGRDRSSLKLTRAIRDFSFVLHHVCKRHPKESPILQKLYEIVCCNLNKSNSAIAKHFEIALDVYDRVRTELKGSQNEPANKKPRKTPMQYCVEGWKLSFCEIRLVSTALVRQLLHSSKGHVKQDMLYPCDEQRMKDKIEERRQAEYIGAKQLAVSKELLRLLEFSDECPTMEKILARLSDQVWMFPDWQPKNQLEKSFCEDLVDFASKNFGKFALRRSLHFKQWPSGTKSNRVAVVPILSVQCFVVDPQLLMDNTRVHDWMRSQGESCWVDGSKHGTNCNGTCAKFQFLESLKAAILKIDSRITTRDLERERAKQVCRVPITNSQTTRSSATKQHATQAHDATVKMGEKERTKVQSPTNDHFHMIMRNCVYMDQAHFGAIPPRGPQFACGCSATDPDFVPPKLKYVTALPGSELSFYVAQACRDRSTLPSAPCELGVIIAGIAEHAFQWPSFQITKKCRIFWEEQNSNGQSSKTIAYNQNGTLYFNAWFYAKLKHDQNESHEDALGYWFVTFCHELAHNQVKKHNQAFATIMGDIVSAYLPAFRRLPMFVDKKH